MLLSLLAFILSAILLFLSSQALLSRLFRLLPLNLLFFLLLPGIFLHEFSHILAAEVLRVPTGELKLRPELKDGHLSLGSAQIASTDPIRLTLIGTAPFLAGLVVLWLLISVGLNLNLSHGLLPQIQSLIVSVTVYRLVITVYLIFAITNTMFSSSSDLQSAGLPVILVLILLGSFKLLNVSLPTSLIISMTNLFWLLTTIFSLTLLLNLILLLPLKSLTRR